MPIGSQNTVVDLVEHAHKDGCCGGHQHAHPEEHTIHDFSGCGQTSEGCGGACQETKTPAFQDRISYTDKVYWQAFAHIASELPWAPNSLLDMGCGNATQLSFLAGSNPWIKRIEALESTKELYDRAIGLHPCRVKYHFVDEKASLPFTDQRFEMVVSHGYLNFVPNPQAALKELLRVSNGIVVLSVLSPIALGLSKFLPNLPFWLLNGRTSVEAPKSSLSMDEIKALLHSNGYQVQSIMHPWPYTLISAIEKQ